MESQLLKILKLQSEIFDNIIESKSIQIDLSNYIKAYPFNNMLIDDNGIIYNPNNNNTIVGYKNDGKIIYFND